MSSIFNNWRNSTHVMESGNRASFKEAHPNRGNASIQYKGHPALQLSLNHNGKILSEDIEAEATFRYQSNTSRGSSHVAYAQIRLSGRL